MSNIRIAFFDAKDYDRDSFIKANNKNEYDITYFETRLSEDTVRLADGYDAVCVRRQFSAKLRRSAEAE